MQYDCPTCGAAFAIEQLLPPKVGENKVNHCPYCDSSAVRPKPELTLEERKQTVEDAVRRGFHGT